MPDNDGSKLCTIEHPSLNELKQASLVLGTTGLERNCGEMFSGKYINRDASHLFSDCLLQRFMLIGFMAVRPYCHESLPDSKSIARPHSKQSWSSRVRGATDPL